MDFDYPVDSSILCADFHNVKAVKCLLDAGANIQICDLLGNNALHVAISMHSTEESCLDSILLLLNAGIDINWSNNEGETALDYAVHVRSVDIVEILLENGVEVNRADSIVSALTLAAIAENEKLVELLLEHDANVDFQNANGVLPLHLIDWLSDHMAILTIIERTVDINRRDDFGFTLLHYAARKGNAILVQLLLQAGADISVKTRTCHYTALHVVTEDNPQGSIDVIRVLLKYGADPNERDLFEFTPLLFALERCDIEVIKLLSDYGADFAVKNCEGQSALHSAAINPHGDIISYVLDKGVDVNVKNYETPLHIVVRCGTPESCSILLERGADIWSKDDYTSLHKQSPLFTYVESRDLCLSSGKMPQTELVGLILIAHIVKLECFNNAIDEEHRELIEDDPELSKHYEACKAEIRTMKDFVVHYNLTLFDVLFASRRQMSIFARNDDLVREINELLPNISEYLHIYCSSMLTKFKYEASKQRQIKRAQRMVCNVMDLNNPSHLVCEMIVGYLGEEELRNIEKAF